MPKYNLSGKFYLGVFLVLASLLIGKITLVVFVVNFDDGFLRWSALAVYILSWPMLILGVWWAGKEYAEGLRKYFSYRFYHESMKKGTSKVYQATKDKTKVVRDKVKGKLNGLKKTKVTSQ